MLTVGCSFTSTKNLTEDSSRDLIKEYTLRRNEGLRVSIGGVVLSMRRTPVDYTSSSASGGGTDDIIKRLLDRKLVVKTPIIASYKKVSGTFSRQTGDSAKGYQLRVEYMSNRFLSQIG